MHQSDESTDPAYASTSSFATALGVDSSRRIRSSWKYGHPLAGSGTIDATKIAEGRARAKDIAVATEPIRHAS